MEQVLTRQQGELVALERKLVMRVRDILGRSDGSRADLERLGSLVNEMDELFLLVIVGEKAQGPSPPDHSFHLVEREFGRFARAVPLTGAFDIPATRATMRNGELTVHLPKRIERRGQGHRIPVTTPGPGPA